MPSYLVETYLARGSADQRPALDKQAGTAAEELTTGERQISFKGSIFLPADEICFFVFVAATARDALIAAERAALGPIRVLEAISSDNQSHQGKEQGGTSCGEHPQHNDPHQAAEHSRFGK